MEYRKLPHGEEQISVIGLGNSSLGGSGVEETERTVAMALENGINYFDMAAGDATPFAPYGRVTQSCRDRVYFQVHLAPTTAAAFTVGRSTSSRSSARSTGSSSS